MSKKEYNSALVEYLADYVSEHKKRRIDEVLGLRTRQLTVVLEDIYKPHNASAVLRTCECYGIQDLHIVEQEHQYDINPYVTRGAAQWVTMHRYDNPENHNIESCFRKLKEQNYHIVATSVEDTSVEMDEIPLDGKIALVFGTEFNGISDYVKTNADDFVKIPMLGFTDSYNISVSAAILLQQIMPQLRTKENWMLTDIEKQQTRLDWYRQIVKNVDIHERKFQNERSLIE